MPTQTEMNEKIADALVALSENVVRLQKSVRNLETRLAALEKESKPIREYLPHA